MKKQISIIVPIYNGKDFLPYSLQSLREQINSRIEVILIDDGSTDGSGALIDSFAQEFPEVKVIRQPNRGYGAACNAGLDVATGEYVAIFEPDDLLSSGFYADLYRVAYETKADIIRYNGFYSYKATVNGLRFAHYGSYSGRVYSTDSVRRLWTSHPAIWNALYRREALQEGNVRFPETPGASFQDAQFHVSLYYTMKTIAVLDSAGYYYREHPAQSVNTADGKVDAVVEGWNAQLAWLQDNNYRDIDYFVFNTFAQFHTLYNVRLARAESRQKLFKAVKHLVRKTNTHSLKYVEASPEHRLLFRLLPFYPIAAPLYKQFVRIGKFKRALFRKSMVGAKKIVNRFVAKPKLSQALQNSLLFESILANRPAGHSCLSVEEIWVNILGKAQYLAIRLKDYFALCSLIPNARIVSAFHGDFRRLLPKADAILLWSQFRDAPALTLLEHAYTCGRPVVFMEEGLIRSIAPTPDKQCPMDYKVPLSFIADLKGSYFDVTKPSMLEDMLNSDRELTDAEVKRARSLIHTILTQRLSKLNHQPDEVPDLGDPDRPKILVVDQAFNDWSIRKGAADIDTFNQMLFCALKENPDADIVVKTHPDMLADPKRGGGTRKNGHYGLEINNERVIFLTDLVNPIALLEKCEKVYVCSSQMGFEALMCGKPTVIFGAPFYAGWGVGDVRNTTSHLLRRHKSRTVEEIFFFTYVEYTRYVNPYTMRPCNIEQFLEAMVALRAMYRNEQASLKTELLTA